MRKGEKMDMTLSIIIFVVVICVLVFLTINRRIDESFNASLGQRNQSGVKVTILKEGMGEVIGSEDTILINYIGSLENGKVFESNIGEEPFILTLGSTPVIKGWGIGVEGMKVGEKRNIEINPEYAYGVRGVPGIVPPYAKLVYEVELVAIKN